MNGPVLLEAVTAGGGVLSVTNTKMWIQPNTQGRHTSPRLPCGETSLQQRARC